MKGEIPMNSGDEYDALTGWKNYVRFRAGERARIKNKYRRRIRRVERALIRSEIETASENV